MSHDDVKGHVKIYIGVFVALMVLTAITVAVSYVHLAVPLAVTVALIIAILKGSLVASVFMHLSNEKKLIYSSLVLTVVFFVVLMALPILTNSDGLHYPDGARSATAGTSGVLKPHAKPAVETKPH
jgi:cytochrome c oxidase subunit 4